MAKMTPSPAILLLTLLLLITPPPSQSLPYSQYRTLFSLAHSLKTRVANLRASSGDHAGSEWARNIAAKMESGLGLVFMWSAGRDYLKNCSWRELPYAEMYGAASEMSELMRWLGELTRKESDSERSASLLHRLLRVFSQSGSVREVVKAFQKEVVEGELLKDYLELGSIDFRYCTLFSLTHSLMTRVANLRASRGDHVGSDRARNIAAKMESGLGLVFMCSAGRDYLKNYSWRELPYTEMYDAVSEMSELMRWLGELTRKESDSERSASLLHRLLRVFSQSGVVREVVKAFQKEVVEGELLKDCLELGSNDFRGVLQILKDLGLQYSSAASSISTKNFDISTPRC
ncbi:hypothetical protein ACLB2K_033643 [Fragaria x ananassa]